MSGSIRRSGRRCIGCTMPDEREGATAPKVGGNPRCPAETRSSRRRSTRQASPMRLSAQRIRATGWRVWSARSPSSSVGTFRRAFIGTSSNSPTRRWIVNASSRCRGRYWPAGERLEFRCAGPRQDAARRPSTLSFRRGLLGAPVAPGVAAAWPRHAPMRKPVAGSNRGPQPCNAALPRAAMPERRG